MSEIIYFIVTIAILVFVHEFGHFAAAKLSGMRADVFAIGFGYRLFGWNKLTGFSFGNLPKDFDGQGNTDYRLCAIPLGGYVKIAGMVDESMDTNFTESEPQPWEFRSKPVLSKVFVITAGVLMNLLLAFVIFWGLNFYQGKEHIKTTTIGEVEPGSKADSAGFVTGDKILAVNGKNVNAWEDVRSAIFIDNNSKDLKVDILRNGEKTTLDIPKGKVPKDDVETPFILAEQTHVVMGQVMPNSAAEKGGVKSGDILLAIDGNKIYSSSQTIKLISSSKEKEIKLTLLRDKDTISLTATPNKEGKIGVALSLAYLGPIENMSYGFFESMTRSVSDIGRVTGLTFTMLKNVISGNMEFKQAFGGPIKIAQMAARSADSGWVNFLFFLAMLSLSLAIINILPFPVLDGGHLVIILIEGAIRRELSLKVKMYIQTTGFWILMLLMAFVLYNDILSL